jgi:hypothetical protein
MLAEIVAVRDTENLDRQHHRDSGRNYTRNIEWVGSELLAEGFGH